MEYDSPDSSLSTIQPENLLIPGCCHSDGAESAAPMSEHLAQINGSAQVQALFQKLFESSPDAILVAAADGQIREANLQAERLFGYPRGELIGTTIETLIPERFRK